jgi:hypothetical protein
VLKLSSPFEKSIVFLSTILQAALFATLKAGPSSRLIITERITCVGMAIPLSKQSLKQSIQGFELTKCTEKTRNKLDNCTYTANIEIIIIIMIKRNRINACTILAL